MQPLKAPAMILPDRIVNRIADPLERRRHMTIQEAQGKYDACLERKEHRAFIGWLERNEYAYAHSRTDKRATTNLGVPDFIIGCAVGLAIEFKVGGNTLSPEQKKWRTRHIRRGGQYFIASHYAEAVEILETYGEGNTRQAGPVHGPGD